VGGGGGGKKSLVLGGGGDGPPGPVKGFLGGGGAGGGGGGSKKMFAVGRGKSWRPRACESVFVLGGRCRGDRRKSQLCYQLYRQVAIKLCGMD